MKKFAFILAAFIALATKTICPAQSPAVVPAALKKPGFTMADLKAQVPQNNDGTFLMEVPAILNTSTDREVQVLLTGQPIQTTGQVVTESVAGSSLRTLRICRSQLQCCSEHARQCSVALVFPAKTPALPDLAWVTLIGTISYKMEAGKMVPILSVKEFKEIPKPANALLQ